MSEEKSICRDYERGVCNRGNKCKFYHPEDVKEPSSQKLPICKDFQNKGCDRNKCKFLHITTDEEAEYMQTGVLPIHGGHPSQMGSHGGGGGGVGNDVCKDFLNGICQRGNRCKFRHISEDENMSEKRGGMGGGMGGSMRGGMDGGGMASMYGKRRRDESSELMEENEMLRRKITDLQRQVLDLRQMNDTLYDQNTRYRNQLRGPTVPDPYTAKSVAYPSSASTADISGRSAYDGYSSFGR